MANIILLLDMQNLWDGCRSQFGKRARLNFKTIINKARIRKNDKVRTVAFIALQPDKNQESLIKKLQEIDIQTITKVIAPNDVADFSEEMLEVLTNALDESDCIVLGSGNAVLLPVVKIANRANKGTMLIAISSNLDKGLAQEADDIRLLSKQDTIINEKPHK
jgi:uncharacterized LabA/DUF88 family protein